MLGKSKAGDEKKKTTYLPYSRFFASNSPLGDRISSDYCCHPPRMIRWRRYCVWGSPSRRDAELCARGATPHVFARWQTAKQWGVAKCDNNHRRVEGGVTRPYRERGGSWWRVLGNVGSLSVCLSQVSEERVNYTASLPTPPIWAFLGCISVKTPFFNELQD